MNKKYAFTGILILIFAISLYYNFSLSNIKNRLYFPQASMSVKPGIVSVSGKWTPQDYSSYTFFLPKDITTTDILCDKSNGICSETRTILAYSDNTFSLKDYSLFTNHFEYQITEWTDKYLKAILNGEGRVFDLTINFTNKFATIVIYDSQKNSTASPGSQTATLTVYQDVVIEDCSDLTPKNPYPQGSSEHTGFVWSELDRGYRNCEAYNKSFIFGCMEYVRQAINYYKCEDNQLKLKKHESVKPILLGCKEEDMVDGVCFSDWGE